MNYISRAFFEDVFWLRRSAELKTRPQKHELLPHPHRCDLVNPDNRTCLRMDGLQVDIWVICCEENKSQSQNISAILWARGSAATSPPGEDESTILGDEQQAYDSIMWQLTIFVPLKDINLQLFMLVTGDVCRRRLWLYGISKWTLLGALTLVSNGFKLTLAQPSRGVWSQMSPVVPTVLI